MKFLEVNKSLITYIAYKLFTELYKVRQESDRQQGLTKNFLPVGLAIFYTRCKKLKKNFEATCYSLAESGCP